MKFGSVCSGIEAASVAWAPLGWKASWFSEIDPFPSALLAVRFPETPNLGDMRTLPERILSGEVSAPDILCGGTPCQAFSYAGKRRSLDDERGNLSLIFCKVVDAIDSVRAIHGQRPCVLFWENVPGVLNTKDNAFGCFLGGGLLDQTLPYHPAQGNGQVLVWLPAPSAKSRGACLTLNISECPSDAVGSSLSRVLEKGLIPQKYFLSQRACEGILRRAEDRRKTLPPTFKEALLNAST